MNDTKPCRKCGKPFKRSRADSTVNCPDCRGGSAKKARSYNSISCCKCGTEFTSLRCPGCGF